MRLHCVFVFAGAFSAPHLFIVLDAVASHDSSVPTVELEFETENGLLIHIS